MYLSYNKLCFIHDEVRILSDITGEICPGEFIGLMGSTGSGKTTLLNLLSNRLRPTSGDILYDGYKLDIKYNRNVAYVMQDDILFPNLTVKQTLKYTANLRLQHLSELERENIVEQLINDFNLIKVSDKRVGNQEIRGISGGERKRVNIANELLSYPKILFLDEPTSGLDTSTSNSIMSRLKQMTKTGISIVVSIHHPSSEIYKMFDKLIFLSQGNTIFYGKRSRARQYFKTLGYKFSKKQNLADCVMGLIVTEELNNEGKSQLSNKLIQNWKNEIPVFTNTNQSYTSTYSLNKVRTNYSDIITLLKRSVVNNIRSQLDYQDFIQIILFAFIMGGMWWQLSYNSENINDRTGVLFLSLLFIAVFRPAYVGLFEFPDERIIVKKERFSESYTLGSYFISKTLSELPFLFIHPTIFFTIIYFMIGFKLQADAFFINYLFFMLAAYCCNSIGLAISSMTGSNVQRATLILDSYLMTLSNASGYWNKHMNLALGWLRYISPISYAYNGILVTEFSGTNWTVSNSGISNSSIIDSTLNNLTITGDQVLKDYNVIFYSIVPCILILLGWIVLYRVLAFLILIKTMKN